MNIKIYKRGQGKHTRRGTAGALGIMAVMGCNSLYSSLSTLRNSAGNTGVWLQAGITALVLAGVFFGIYKLVNWVRFADFLIKTEGEIKKVSWSAKKEVITSTKVVLITVISMAILLYAVDFVLVEIFGRLGILNI
ncbi:MAG: preprotein translocase subunit SecE [Phycisphaerae bacterium]|nr:preprotein translocase subunit SecE [Phycisphaerae bacterium]